MAIENLKIRRAEVDDCVAIAALFEAPSVYAGTLQVPYPSLEYWRRRLSDNPETSYNLIGFVDDRLVGMVNVHTITRPRRKHAGSIGICVHEEWQGKGVGSALMQALVDLADNWLNLTRLELEVYADNEAAIHLYERFGFEVEGRLRKHAFRDGQYIDSIVMGRVR